MELPRPDSRVDIENLLADLDYTTEHQSPLPEPPNGAVYPAGIHGNYQYPTNFVMPNFCDDCPLVEEINNPQISRTRGLYPNNTGGVRHIGPFADYVADVLVLNEAGKPEISPVYLGELDIVSPFSVQHESPVSRTLGRAHRRVNDCERPGVQKKLFRPEKLVCMSGLTKVIDFYESGWRLSIDESDLNTPFNIVVGPNLDSLQ